MSFSYEEDVEFFVIKNIHNKYIEEKDVEYKNGMLFLGGTLGYIIGGSFNNKQESKALGFLIGSLITDSLTKKKKVYIIYYKSLKTGKNFAVVENSRKGLYIGYITDKI